MGDVITFPGEYQAQAGMELEPELPALIREAAHFSRLTCQQQALEVRTSQFGPPSLAQLRMDRIAVGALDVRIDESVERLQEAPANHEEALHNLHMLFSFAEAHPDDTDNLEVAALYTASAYWDGDHVDTAYIAPLFRARASAALLRSSGNSLPPVIDMIRAVVTSHVTSCVDEQRYARWHQLRQFGLLDFFEVAPDGPEDHPPAPAA